MNKTCAQRAGEGGEGSSGGAYGDDGALHPANVGALAGAYSTLTG